MQVGTQVSTQVLKIQNRIANTEAQPIINQ